MERPSSLVEELESDRPSLGIVLKSMSPMTAEALGYTDIAYLFVDFQHSTPDFSQLDHIVRAADLNDLPVVVRVPREDFSMITYLLDSGVRGIILPQVEDTEIIKEANTHIRYDDGRSLGTTTRTAKFGEFEQEDYFAYVNQELALIPMIESEKGVKNADTITGLDETSAVLIGTGDLSHSLGVEMGNQPHSEAVNKVFNAGQANDCPIGIPARSPAHLDEYREQASFLLYGTDVDHVKSWIEDVTDRAYE